MHPFKHKLAKEWIYGEAAPNDVAKATWEAMDAEFKANRKIQLAEVPRSEMDNFNTPDLEQAPDSYLRPGETLEDFDVTFRRPNAQGGRTSYKYAGVVKQGPNTGKHKYTDFYPKGKKGGTAEWFNSKKEMNEALQKRKEASGRGLTNEELTKKFKTQLKAKGYETWNSAPDNVKRSISSSTTPSAIAKKEEEPRFKKEGLDKRLNEETRKLLAEKKPINPKTGLPYTLKEYTDLTAGQKGKLLNRLKGKFKSKLPKPRQGYYPEKDANKLINFLKISADKQKKNNVPLKERTFINVFEDDKFVGVRDVKANTLYTHIDYTGNKKGTSIALHPSQDETLSFLKEAKKFKFEKPEKLLGSYFSEYERVPTYNEIYNFFNRDRNAPLKSFKQNALEIHHRNLIEKVPDKNFQLVTMKKNTEANRILNLFNNKQITKQQADTALKNLGVNLEGMGKQDITTGKSLGSAKRETIKLFKDAYKNNPNVIEDMTKKLNIDLLKLAGTKNKKCKELLAYGGRVGLAEGLSPEFCINEGKKVARNLVAKNIKGSPAQNNIIKRITSGVFNFAKSILDPKELFDLKKQFLSKGALASIPIFDAVMAADDALRKDMDPKEAFAKTLTFGTLPKALGFTDSIDVINAKKMLEDSSLSPAGKEYAQLIIDSGDYEKMQSDTTGGMTKKFNEFKEMQEKIKNASTAGRFDYEKLLTEKAATDKAGEYVGEPQKVGPGTYLAFDGEEVRKVNEFGYARKGTTFDAPDKPDVTPLINKFATPAKSRGPMTEKKKQKVDYTPLTYENYKPFSFTKEEFEDTMRQIGSLKEGQVYDDTFYKEQIETPMRAEQFKEYMELPSFRGTQFSKGGIASLNVFKK